MKNILELFDIKEESKVPKYKQIVDSILRAIDSAKLKLNDKLPSVNDLLIEFDVSRDTVVRAYDQLKQRKVIESVPGKGYYVKVENLSLKAKVFLIFNKLSAHKKLIYDAFAKTLGDDGTIDFFIYENNYRHFKDLILAGKKRDYSHFVTICHFEEGGDDLLNFLKKEIPHFVNSFEAFDTRTSQIITEWTSTASGELVLGLGNDQSFPYKLPFDPNSNAFFAGNDIPIIRYSDVLLMRAEALNEVSGPTQEAIDLINQVRTRSGATPLDLAGFTTESLREAILQEREWELYFEGNAREDQIRHGVMISRAQARGKNAQEFHRLYPIPQVELDANPALEQNPGYY